MEEKIEGMYSSFLNQVRSFENRMGEIMAGFTSMFDSPTLDPGFFPAPPKVYIDNDLGRQTFLIRTQKPLVSEPVESDWIDGRIISWIPGDQARINGFARFNPNFIDESGTPKFVSIPETAQKSVLCGPDDAFSWYQLPLIVYSFIGIIFLMMTFVLTALLVRRRKLKRLRRELGPALQNQATFSPVTAESISVTVENKAAFDDADAPPDYSMVMDAKGLPPHSPPAYSKNEEKREEFRGEKPPNSPCD
ncbi:Oidioi.mRNA.OKI2018_I69.PAR.g11979.t1.cds [Oikopleura dioica]|uniref:Oidioi.mRNA.OKI2018_I69.PAR.g11979.t1.cds n=1 Tax=Oikopleura dioica TaxID=34765 RepID=A0ABN7S1Q8_OIKDI|nr:Oidioi.mRNA.OKI2018_I69.PAR.g11979.t1.cds [Oikopleura dioica]